MSRYIIDTDKYMSPFDGIIMTTVSGLEDADKEIDVAYQRGREEGNDIGYKDGVNDGRNDAWEAARKIIEMTDPPI